MIRFNSKEDFENYINNNYPADFAKEIFSARDFVNGNVYTTYYVNTGNSYAFEETKANYVFKNIWSKK